MRNYLVLLLIACCVAPQWCIAQDGWNAEGALKRWQGASITSPHLGCFGAEGAPMVETNNSLTNIGFEGATTTKQKPELGPWRFLPRNPNIVCEMHDPGESGEEVVLTFHDVWLNEKLSEVTLSARTDNMLLDVTKTWVSADAQYGCIVFSPLPSSAPDNREYLFAFFEGGGNVTFQRRVKEKVDVDIYVRPHEEKRVVLYLRGNGISFPPDDEEVFTNGGYLSYEPDGTRATFSLPARGPGSGKGRRIIWHSNKWDRLLMVDEFASGGILIKASNGIIVDSITQSKIDGGQLKVLSASGNNTDKWMATHARVGSKNALILWSMPDTKEVTAVEFSQSDAALKHMPLSPWSIVIPFLSVNGSANNLFSWNPQDVVSVNENEQLVSTSVFPNPATAATITAQHPNMIGNIRYVVVDAQGNRMQFGENIAVDGELLVDVKGLPSGNYTLMWTQQGSGNSGLHYQQFVVTR